MPQAVATGVGAVTGEDPDEAATVVINELPGWPHVPELPERGLWAEPAARSAALLVELPVELEIGRWRTASRPGRDGRRAQSMFARDLDAVEEQWQGYQGPAKVQVLGPVSLAASIELQSGHLMVSDHVAMHDVAASLAEGVAALVSDLRSRVPGGRWTVQLDEPDLVAVTAGGIARPSGWGTVAAVPTADAAALIRQVSDAARSRSAAVLLHSCGEAIQGDVITTVAPDGVSLDLTSLDLDQRATIELLEQWWDGIEMVVLADVVDGDRLRRVRGHLGVGVEAFADRVAVTHPCAAPHGSAGVSPAAYADLQRMVKQLSDQ